MEQTRLWPLWWDREIVLCGCEVDLWCGWGLGGTLLCPAAAQSPALLGVPSALFTSSFKAEYKFIILYYSVLAIFVGSLGTIYFGVVDTATVNVISPF